MTVPANYGAEYNALRAIQEGSLSIFMMVFGITRTRTHDLPCEADKLTTKPTRHGCDIRQTINLQLLSLTKQNEHFTYNFVAMKWTVTKSMWMHGRRPMGETGGKCNTGQL